jgi:hypothetical protein
VAIPEEFTFRVATIRQRHLQKKEFTARNPITMSEETIDGSMCAQTEGIDSDVSFLQAFKNETDGKNKSYTAWFLSLQQCTEFLVQYDPKTVMADTLYQLVSAAGRRFLYNRMILSRISMKAYRELQEYDEQEDHENGGVLPFDIEYILGGRKPGKVAIYKRSTHIAYDGAWSLKDDGRHVEAYGCFAPLIILFDVEHDRYEDFYPLRAAEERLAWAYLSKWDYQDLENDVIDLAFGLKRLEIRHQCFGSFEPYFRDAEDNDISAPVWLNEQLGYSDVLKKLNAMICFDDDDDDETNLTEASLVHEDTCMIFEEDDQDEDD